jgi:hypothetical protein
MAAVTSIDVLHRATLSTRELLPVNNHASMLLPVEPQYATELYKEILHFLWTKERDGHTKQ